MKHKLFRFDLANKLSLNGTIALLLILVCGPCLVFVCIPDIIRNNIQLSRFADNLYQYPLPPNTTVVNKYSTVTLLGNSNHCDFVAELTLQTLLSRSAIEQYYDGVSFPPARSEHQGWEDFFTTGIHPGVNVQIEFSQETLDGYLQYKLKIIDFGYPPGFDIRCH